ncbi:Putative stomatin/prohibitin-family membrane protease subunit aq_911 [Citrobacter freundii]|uniref:Stomatin/prohibitin-family membrane protease subunit aq_911 n=1 Tax=Citrobacter freundii TaxID=546 RepID=A0A7G2IHU1_CITFR|nr:Putative stomatin/prohibitin-family membrane protease subunit aq_911 [Citrobacter freundii]
MAKKITIQKAQLGLLSREGDYYQVLEAGQHRLPWFNTPEVLIVNRDGGEVPQALAEYLRRFQPEWVARFCLVADTTDTEAAALYINGVFAGDPATGIAPSVLESRRSVNAGTYGYARGSGANGRHECSITAPSQRCGERSRSNLNGAGSGVARRCAEN